jgi:hypothetical protein
MGRSSAGPIFFLVGGWPPQKALSPPAKTASAARDGSIPRFPRRQRYKIQNHFEPLDSGRESSWQGNLISALP